MHQVSLTYYKPCTDDTWWQVPGVACRRVKQLHGGDNKFSGAVTTATSENGLLASTAYGRHVPFCFPRAKYWLYLSFLTNVQRTAAIIKDEESQKLVNSDVRDFEHSWWQILTTLFRRSLADSHESGCDQVFRDSVPSTVMSLNTSHVSVSTVQLRLASNQADKYQTLWTVNLLQ